LEHHYLSSGAGSGSN
jgi:hypothetical protein